MKIVSSDGQLSIDNMDVAPVRVGGVQRHFKIRLKRVIGRYGSEVI